MQQGGWSLQIPEPQSYYKVLRKHHVKIHPRRGVQILGLYYRSEVLDDPRYLLPSERGGKHAGKWMVHSDRRQVFFQDPVDHDTWHTLRWTGLPPEGEVPAFSDKSAEALLAEVRARKLAPRSDEELLPVLVELLGATTPVDQWPSQQAKRERKRDRAARSRESDRADQAAADRAKAADPSPPPGGQASEAARAVDSSRRRRREGAARREPVAPPLLHDSLRRGGLFLLPPVTDLPQDRPSKESM